MTTERKRRMTLSAFLAPRGLHLAGWRHPRAQPEVGEHFEKYLSAALTAERAKFDIIVLSDSMGIRGLDLRTRVDSAYPYVDQFEPITLMSALAVTTSHIGLGATASTTYNEPYHIARKFASLDHLSRGRAAWNVVTSVGDYEAQNFGRDAHMDHAARYGRADEFVDVVKGLWDTWDDGALLQERETGRYFDPDKVYFLNHAGEHFKVRGPLNLTRPPQGHPIVVQAGSSPAVIQSAGRGADILITSQSTLAGGREFYQAVKAAAAHNGRPPEAIRVLPGLRAIVGRTRDEALEKEAELQALLDPQHALGFLSFMLGYVDLSAYDLDGPVPDLPVTNASQQRQQSLLDLARREGLTLRQLSLKVAGKTGDLSFADTPKAIADAMEEWFLGGAADGFNVTPPYVPGGLDDFARLVVPELQRRGLFRTHYESDTLRGNLGLPLPANTLASPARSIARNVPFDYAARGE